MLACLRPAMAATLLTLLSCAQAQDKGQCTTPAEVRVSAAEGQVQYVQKSTQDITNIYRQYAPGSTLIAAGLTVAHIQFRIMIDASRTDSSRCVLPSVQIIVDPGFQTIYISDALPPGSCSYEEIRKHELRHVAINREASAQAAALMQKRLISRISSVALHLTPAQVERQLTDIVYKEEVPVIRDHLKKQVDTDHAAHDSHEEYARLNNSCNKELQKLKVSAPDQSTQ